METDSDFSTSGAAWEPPFSLEERLKHALVPGPLYIRYRAWKEWRKGEPELRLIPELADPGRNAVDVGANKGVYTYVLARHCGHVYAFEPNPKIYRILQRNTAWAANISVSPLALGAQAGTATMRIPGKGASYSNQGGSLRANMNEAHGEVTVETARLDDLDIRDVGFLKIDVEGFELEVLAGAVGTVARDHPVIQAELEPRFLGRPLDEAIRRIEEMGYAAHAVPRDRLERLAPPGPERERQVGEAAGRYVNNFIFLPADGAGGTGS